MKDGIKGFSQTAQEAVIKKLKQAYEIASESDAALKSGTTVPYSFVAFVYEKLKEEDFTVNGSVLNPFKTAKKAELHSIDGGKKDDE